MATNNTFKKSHSQHAHNAALKGFTETAYATYPTAQPFRGGFAENAHTGSVNPAPTSQTSLNVLKPLIR